MYTRFQLKQLHGRGRMPDVATRSSPSQFDSANRERASVFSPVWFRSNQSVLFVVKMLSPFQNRLSSPTWSWTLSKIPACSSPLMDGVAAQAPAVSFYHQYAILRTSGRRVVLLLVYCRYRTCAVKTDHGAPCAANPRVTSMPEGLFPTPHLQSIKTK